MDDTNRKRESAEDKKAKKERKDRELRQRRENQLTGMRRAAAILEDELRAARLVMKRRDALSSHCDGFYIEVNKLAKGRVLLQVTDLVMSQANDIIRDAKGIVKGDVYLDRTKEFVPAGDNPVYPDVLVSIRSVQGSLHRCLEEFDARNASLRKKLQKAETVVGALEYFLGDHEGGADERNYPSREAVEGYVDGRVSDSCFVKYSDSSEEYFDFERLDEGSLEDYLKGEEDTATSEVESARKPEDANGRDAPGDEEESSSEGET